MSLSNYISLKVEQPYYADGLAKDLTFHPSEETAKLISQYAILLKYSEHGIEFFLKSESDKSILKSNIELVFSISSSDPYIRTHSIIPDVGGKTIIYHNKEVITSGGQLSVINSDSDISANNMQFIAALKIVISPNLYTQETTTQYSIRWEASSRQWKYYYIGKQSFDAPIIEHESISFDRQVIAKDNEIYQKDSLAQKLFNNFPKAHHWVFTSEENVLYQSEPYKDIKLMRDSEVIIPHLPNPRKENNGNHIINALNNFKQNI